MCAYAYVHLSHRSPKTGGGRRKENEILQVPLCLFVKSPCAREDRDYPGLKQQGLSITSVPYLMLSPLREPVATLVVEFHSFGVSSFSELRAVEHIVPELYFQLNEIQNQQNPD